MTRSFRDSANRQAVTRIWFAICSPWNVEVWV